LGYIGIVQHKKHSPEVSHNLPGTPCMYVYIYIQICNIYIYIYIYIYQTIFSLLTP